MAQLVSPPENQFGSVFTVNISGLKLTPAQFQKICSDNRDLRLELTSTGDLIVMPPAGSSSGLRNFNLIVQLGAWVERDGTGVAFDSSAGFSLPNGAIRSPDAAWLLSSRWESLSSEQKESFAPLCPDFVVEIRSQWQTLDSLIEKMDEYLRNGARLGWLIDPFERRVHVFSPGGQVKVLENPKSVSGDPILPGFLLNTLELWK
jgi:Uma2 family endonuclease